MKFRVCVREVHIQGYVVEAASPDEAIGKVADGEGEMDEGHFEYSHTLDTDYWTAYEDRVLELPRPPEKGGSIPQ
jgi:hypothetical protein